MKAEEGKNEFLSLLGSSQFSLMVKRRNSKEGKRKRKWKENEKKMKRKKENKEIKKRSVQIPEKNENFSFVAHENPHFVNLSENLKKSKKIWKKNNEN